MILYNEYFIYIYLSLTELYQVAHGTRSSEETDRKTLIYNFKITSGSVMFYKSKMDL